MGQVTEVGQLTLGACVPIAATANAALSAQLNVRLPDVEARLAGALAAQAKLAVSLPSLAARIDALLAMVARLQALLELGLPEVTIDLSVMAAAIAALQADLGSINASVAVSAAIGLQLGVPGVWAYSYVGTPGTYGPDFAAEIGAGLPSSGDPNLPIYAVTFIASDAGAVNAMKTVFASV
jgi:hypothetical protein